MLLLGVLAITSFVLQALAQGLIVSFEQNTDSYKLADTSTGPSIAVSSDDWAGVQRAAGDLAVDFGRVTGVNGTTLMINGNTTVQGTTPVIVAGTIGKSGLISAMVQAGTLNVSQTQGKWEAYHTQLVQNPMEGVPQALVIAGADKRGTIFGLYEISSQIGVSPWYFWADVPALPQKAIYANNVTNVQGSPSVKYRGIFINDEQPAITNWVDTNYEPCPDGNAGYNHVFWPNVYELLLRSKANYMWPTTWASMFYIDDPQNAEVADMYGIVMGTSHTEPMTRQTVEQETLLDGAWSWSTNRQNVTAFMKEGVERTKSFETLYTLGMRGLGDASSPTLNASQLQTIVQVQQQLIGEVFNISNVSGIPQMWCLYKEVGGYYAEGLQVPDDVTLLWADDNWADVQRLPVGNETSRSGGAGIYYHADYVGDPRNYKWIDTNSLAKYWSELTQAYARDARNIWILNVGDLKPMEAPIAYFLDMAYDAPSMTSPNSTIQWLNQWAAKQFGDSIAAETAMILSNYSMLAARRKYELMDSSTYSLINYDEADAVLQEWANLATSAQSLYDSVPTSVQATYFQLVLHKCIAGYNYNQVYIAAAKNYLYGLQKRTSTNLWAQRTLNYFNQDQAITNRYHSLLGGKWNHMMDQPHIGYQYWQQPTRNMMPSVAYVQDQEISVAGQLGVTCEATNATIPGDDQFHANSGTSLTLPPIDPYGPERWIEVFTRGSQIVSFNVSSDPYVSVSPSSGMLQGPGGNMTDMRLLVSVDWANAPNGSTVSTINITTTTPSGQYINATYPYGNFPMPQIILPINKTSIADSFHGFVELDGHISIEAEHFSNSTGTGNAHYEVFPKYGRTLSGVALMPFTAASQSATDSSAPKLTYSFYTFTPNVTNANVTLYAGAAMNTNPNQPMKYAVSIDDKKAQVVQPNPLTTLWPLPDMWDGMVANAAASNNTTHAIPEIGAHTLNLWLLEPGLVFQKVVIDLGGVRDSYLGPPESMRV